MRQTAIAGGHRRLVRLLQLAHAGERGATWAYRGHVRSLREGWVRAQVRRITREEWTHRGRLRLLLAHVHAQPSPWWEVVIGLVGAALGALCRWTGWLLPMYGAGAIESRNVHDYVVAADLARRQGLAVHARELSLMAQCERDHERFFRGQVARHPAGSLLPRWPRPRTALAGTPHEPAEARGPRRSGAVAPLPPARSWQLTER